MTARRTGTVALAWWGSLAGGGPTAGDLLALRAAHRTLVADGFKVQVICDRSAVAHVTRWSEVSGADPRGFAALVWICGPLIGGSRPFRDLFDGFQGKPRLAAGVSVLPKTSADHFDQFDVCLARDGADTCYGDVALAAPANGKFQAGSDRVLSFCLRGPQREYGIERCGHSKVADFCDRLRIGEAAAGTIDTRLDRENATVSGIERRFATSRLVVTSRLHGALLALRRGVPVIAIDQIEGGGKVKQVLSRLGWPWTFGVEQLNLREIEAAALHLWTYGAALEVSAARTKAVAEGRRALKALSSSLAEVL